MLDRLLESKVRRRRSLTGTATSVGAHLVVIVAAVHATAQSRVHPPTPTRMVVLSFVPEQPRTEQTKARRTRHNSTSPLPSPVFTIVFDPRIPQIDFLPESPTAPTDFVGGGMVRSAGQEPPAKSGETFRADEVEHQVSVLPGAPVPRYPEALRSAGIEGKVLAQFIVNELGVAEADSVRFLTSDNVLFEESVRNVLRRMRFAPAEIGGKKVRQLVQMPFVFTISAR